MLLLKTCIMKLMTLALLGLSMLLVNPKSEETSAGSPESSEAMKIDDNADISMIRAEYSRINKLALKVERYKYETTDCVEGGEISYHLLNGQILKITETGAMNDTVWKKEYYYKNGRVFFCLESLDWGPGAGPTITTVYRFYIKNGQSIREMADQKIEEVKDKAAENILIASKLLKVRATKNFKSVYCDEPVN